jgi:2-polyprenyl-6-methoxyphenol hydroxylase-like FAD-dependent oxidoreductase
LEEPNKLWQHVRMMILRGLLGLLITFQAWLLAHRVHLHDALKNAAITPNGTGLPAQLFTSSRVASVDAETATVTLESGMIVQGDFILGADGVHSVTRRAVSGRDIKPHGSGKSAFRFLISRQAAQEDPVTAKFVQAPGELIIWYGADRRVVVYPTTNNQLLNFVCIHPEAESEAGSDTWNKEANLDQMLKIYKGFDPAMVALISKANVESLKAWKLLDMEVMTTWVKGRLALLGDAAHPFTPHQGQGAGQAIEDAATLGVVFPADTKKDEITARLELYEKIRKERAERIQEYSRIAGSDLKEGVKNDSG